MTASDPSPAFMPAALGSGLVLLVAIAGVCAAAGHAAAGLWVAAAGGLALGAAATVLLHRQTGARQAAGAALQAAMARVGGIVDSAMDPIITVDERIVQFNAAAEDVFRWPRRAALGQPLDMLLPQRFRGAHRQHIAQFGQTGVTNRRMGASSVLTGMRADGEEFPVEASISQHSEGGRKYYTVILRDVTLRERSAVLLANSEARLRNIVESAMDAIITVDEAQ